MRPQTLSPVLCSRGPSGASCALEQHLANAPTDAISPRAAFGSCKSTPQDPAAVKAAAAPVQVLYCADGEHGHDFGRAVGAVSDVGGDDGACRLSVVRRCSDAHSAGRACPLCRLPEQHGVLWHDVPPRLACRTADCQGPEPAHGRRHRNRGKHRRVHPRTRTAG